MSAEGLVALRTALAGRDAWLVGGAPRDRRLGRPVDDLDVVVDGDVRGAARRVAAELRGAVFELSGTHGAWRVLSADRSWHADLSPLHGEGIHADLARRDLTVNAIAEPLDGGDPVDPFGGRADLEAGVLRMVGPASFTDDPLRCVRLPRLGCELGMAPDAATRAAARAAAPGAAGVAQERVFAELKRILVAPAAVAGLEGLLDVGAAAAVLPELEALDGIEQSRFHHRDVLGHTLEVVGACVALEADPARTLGDEALGAQVGALLAEPFADELTRGGALRWACLLHDIAKPATRRDVGGGRVGFPGHDRVGAEASRAILTRLRASERLRAHVALLCREHLRLGFLSHEQPLGRRAVLGYLEACAPAPADVTLLTVCDRLATRGDKAQEAIDRHMALVRTLLADALPWQADPAPAPLVRGDVLARALGVAPGPDLGRLLHEVAAARFAGEVSTPDEAVAHARRVLDDR